MGVSTFPIWFISRNLIKQKSFCFNWIYKFPIGYHNFSGFENLGVTIASCSRKLNFLLNLGNIIKFCKNSKS